jgi:arylsulfatase A-like enzyme
LQKKALPEHFALVVTQRVFHPGDDKLNSESWHRMIRDGYLAACVRYVDKLTGYVLAKLERQGLAKNTMHLSTPVPLFIRVSGQQFS